ncbi:MAG: dihydropteroate synthase [Acidimicrobiia bacterium]|jgi:dihydropteroate synthase
MPDSSMLRLRDREVRFGGITHVMGVVNLSPESANRQSFAPDAAAAVALARRHRQAGATLVDVGGQSSRFDVATLDPAEEIARLRPTIEALVADDFLVSVDTWKPAVAEAALTAGAHIVNDTGGLRDPAMRELVAVHRAGAILVYVEGDNPHDVGEVEIAADKAVLTAERLESRLAELEAAGLTEVVVDPGIALNYRGDYAAYTRLQLDVIRGSAALHRLGRPVLIPIPRKQEDHRVAAYIAMAIEYEADLIRVHDVEMACDLVRLYGRSVG